MFLIIIFKKQKASAKEKKKKNNQMGISALKIIITEITKLSGGAEQWMKETEERISGLEDRTIDITQSV